jgi:hypothetical protein
MGFYFAFRSNFREIFVTPCPKKWFCRALKRAIFVGKPGFRAARVSEQTFSGVTDSGTNRERIFEGENL